MNNFTKICYFFLSLSLFYTTGAAGANRLIKSQYYGASLFIGATVENVVLDQPVTSFSEYRNIYGVESDQSPGQMALSAWAFFRNGGKKLYIRSPRNESPGAYAEALDSSHHLKVDLVAIPAPMAPGLREAVMDILIAHVEQSADRFGLVDPPMGLSSEMLIHFANSYSTKRAALYAPWVRPFFEDIPIPPSAVLAGIITRIDEKRGIYKAPAGREADLKGIRQLESSYSPEQLNALNLAGVNIMRAFPNGLPPLVMGARVLDSSNAISSPYISVQRFLKLLRYSIEKSLSGRRPPLPGARRAIRYQQLIDIYLNNYFVKGAFQGNRPDEAYFGRCRFEDSKIICQVGVSLLKPAEFFTFELSFD